MFKKTRHKTISRIIEDNLDYLVSFAYYRLGNHDEAEDLVYDAILKFLERDTDNIKLESIRLYIFRIVHNLCLDYARSDHKDLLPIENLDIGEGVDEALDLEDADRINACLDALPLREADVIRMHVVDGLSFVEISGILSIPQSTAKSRYKSGMDKLRNLFINNKMS
jgi:RNA polymerase sigma-70 factor (ECF subfamily)